MADRKRLTDDDEFVLSELNAYLIAAATRARAAADQGDLSFYSSGRSDALEMVGAALWGFSGGRYGIDPK